jgi:hypothetical protein
LARVDVVPELPAEPPPHPAAATIERATIEATKLIPVADIIAAPSISDLPVKPTAGARRRVSLGFAPVYDTLLFLHVLTAFILVVTVVVFSAVAIGAPRDARLLGIANAAWAVGGLGTLGFGIWLALYVESYDLLDGWILTAIVLWAIGTELGRRAQVGFTAAPTGGEATGATPLTGQATLMHWLRSLAVLALLVVMIYKPGA